MFKFNKLTEFIAKKTSGNNKKNIENLVIFLVLLIITILAINIIWGENEPEEQPEESEYKVLAQELDSNNSSNIQISNEYNLEEQLEDILSKMEGVGNVSVLITYSETSVVVPMYNESQNTSSTKESDSNGGNRSIESSDSTKEVVKDSNNEPITEKITMPKIEGAIVLAEGGENATIKSNIVQAVAAVTGIATYKVQVFKLST